MTWTYFPPPSQEKRYLVLYPSDILIPLSRTYKTTWGKPSLALSLYSDNVINSDDRVFYRSIIIVLHIYNIMFTVYTYVILYICVLSLYRYKIILIFPPKNMADWYFGRRAMLPVLFHISVHYVYCHFCPLCGLSVYDCRIIFYFSTTLHRFIPAVLLFAMSFSDLLLMLRELYYYYNIIRQSREKKTMCLRVWVIAVFHCFSPLPCKPTCLYKKRSLWQIYIS